MLKGAFGLHPEGFCPLGPAGLEKRKRNTLELNCIQGVPGLFTWQATRRSCPGGATLGGPPSNKQQQQQPGKTGSPSPATLIRVFLSRRPCRQLTRHRVQECVRATPCCALRAADAGGTGCQTQLLITAARSGFILTGAVVTCLFFPCKPKSWQPKPMLKGPGPVCNSCFP